MSTVESQVYDIIAQQTSVDRSQINRNSTMDDLSIASLDLVEVIFSVEEQFDIHVDFDPGNATVSGLVLTTVGDVVAAIEKLVAEKQAAE